MATAQLAWCQEMRGTVGRMADAVKSLATLTELSPSLHPAMQSVVPHLRQLNGTLLMASASHSSASGEFLPIARPDLLLLITELATLQTLLVPQLERFGARLSLAGADSLGTVEEELFWELLAALETDVLLLHALTKHLTHVGLKHHTSATCAFLEAQNMIVESWGRHGSSTHATTEALAAMAGGVTGLGKQCMLGALQAMQEQHLRLQQAGARRTEFMASRQRQRLPGVAGLRRQAGRPRTRTQAQAPTAARLVDAEDDVSELEVTQRKQDQMCMTSTFRLPRPGGGLAPRTGESMVGGRACKLQP
ncbi:MAG: hypothetical protein WDW38_008107 [Sanguina aurantia]